MRKPGKLHRAIMSPLRRDLRASYGMESRTCLSDCLGHRKHNLCRCRVGQCRAGTCRRFFFDTRRRCKLYPGGRSVDPRVVVGRCMVGLHHILWQSAAAGSIAAHWPACDRSGSCRGGEVDPTPDAEFVDDLIALRQVGKEAAVRFLLGGRTSYHRQSRSWSAFCHWAAILGV